MKQAKEKKGRSTVKVVSDSRSKSRPKEASGPAGRARDGKSSDRGLAVKIETLEAMPNVIVLRGTSGERLALASLVIGGSEVVPGQIVHPRSGNGQPTTSSEHPFVVVFPIDRHLSVDEHREARLVLASADQHLHVRIGDAEKLSPDLKLEVYNIFNRFLDSMNDDSRVLELGSRPRHGSTIRNLMKGDYVGVDILDGPNVDVVADAHLLGDALSGRTFTHALAVTVFEHLFCPIQAVAELNAVLEPGGLVYVHTHQTCPIHEYPWDFFRFSDAAWGALFNHVTGFEIVAAGMTDSTRVVPRQEFGGAVYPTPLFDGYMTSLVLAQKIGPATMNRIYAPDDLASFYRGEYPGGPRSSRAGDP